MKYFEDNEIRKVYKECIKCKERQQSNIEYLINIYNKIYNTTYVDISFYTVMNLLEVIEHEAAKRFAEQE